MSRNVTTGVWNVNALLPPSTPRRGRVSLNDAAIAQTSHLHFLLFQLHLLYHNASFTAFMKFLTQLTHTPPDETVHDKSKLLSFFVYISDIISCTRWTERKYESCGMRSPKNMLVLGFVANFFPAMRFRFYLKFDYVFYSPKSYFKKPYLFVLGT